MKKLMHRTVSWVSLTALCLLGASGNAGVAEDRLQVSTIGYRVPDITLVRQDGTQVSLATEVNDGRPVVLNFIFTSCAATCPLMSQIFADFQRKLGPDSAKVHLMSISIDPEQDTPSRLRAYAKRFNAAPGWTYYTGTTAASIAAQKAFNVYLGDKMSHTVVTFMRAGPGVSWRRLEY